MSPLVPAGLTVHEPLGLARIGWPVSTGLPFARGRLRDPAAVTLRESGRSTRGPIQTRILSKWDDGSIRWLLADFPVTVPGGGKSSREVVQLPPNQHDLTAFQQPRVKVREEAAGIIVDTGPLQFTVPRGQFAILSNARLNGESMLGGPVSVGPLSKAGTKGESAGGHGQGSSNTTLSASADPRAPTRVIVRDRGPWRAEIELRGQLSEGFDYVVRLHAFAGQPFVRVLFTFVATGPAFFTEIRELAVQVPLVGKSLSYRLGLEDRRPAHGRVPRSGVTLIQDDNFGFYVNGTRRKGHALGWIEVSGPGSGVGLAGRFFWQEYPKGFQLQPGMLTYLLWPSQSPPLQIGVGAAKTHEFTIVFFKDLPPPGFTAALTHPLSATLDPTWVARTGALPNAVAPTAANKGFLRRLDKAYERVKARTAREVWDEAARVECPPPGKELRRTGAFGMLNWGDWNFPGFHDSVKGCDAWGNLEYDLTQVVALAFLATGKATYHEAMTVAARHFMDVDVIHAQPSRPKWLGMNHPKNPLHFSFARGGVDLGHTWTEGLLSYHYLTGDARALEVARGIADYLVRRIEAGVLRANPRQWGWPQIALLAVFQASGDIRYRDAALKYARRGIAAHPPTPADHWKLGILADALAGTHAATGAAELETWLRPYAGDVVSRFGGDLRFFPAVAYVAAVTGDPKLIRAAERAASRIRFSNWAKPFTISGRTGFRILSLLASAPRVPVAPTPIPGESPVK